MGQPLLIVEDNEQNLYMMQFLLEKHGFAVVAAQNGPDGIEMALRLNPAAILLDIQLPMMDGYAVAAELKKHRELEGIPIVAVTSYAMVGIGRGLSPRAPRAISKNRLILRPLWSRSAAICPNLSSRGMAGV